VKLDLKEDGSTLAEPIHLIDASGMGDDRLWLNAELPVLGQVGFESLRERFPDSTISAPVDFLLPLMLASETAAEARGWEVNLYGVPDLEAFLEASLLLPTSITADFNFPEWRYFGRGSGARA
jgi:hypothetical protein